MVVEWYVGWILVLCAALLMFALVCGLDSGVVCCTANACSVITGFVVLVLMPSLLVVFVVLFW